MDILILCAGMFFGAVTLHASIKASKNGVEHTNKSNALIHLGSTLSMYALALWGFINLIWWVPLVVFVAIFQALRLIVRSSNWEQFYRAIPITGGLTIVITSGAWLKWVFV